MKKGLLSLRVLQRKDAVVTLFYILKYKYQIHSDLCRRIGLSILYEPIHTTYMDILDEDVLTWVDSDNIKDYRPRIGYDILTLVIVLFSIGIIFASFGLLSLLLPTVMIPFFGLCVSIILITIPHFVISSMFRQYFGQYIKRAYLWLRIRKRIK
jgi:hypothetical protein